MHHKYDTGYLFIENQGFFWGGKPSIWCQIVSPDVTEKIKDYCKENDIPYHDTKHTSSFTVKNMMERAAIMCGELVYAVFGEIQKITSNPAGVEFEVNGETVTLIAQQKLYAAGMGGGGTRDFEVTFVLNSESAQALKDAGIAIDEYLESVSYYENIGSRHELLNTINSIAGLFDRPSH